MTADSLINAVNDGVNGGGGVSSSVRRRNMPSVWAQVVRGGTDSDLADRSVVGEKNVNVVAVAVSRVEGSDSGSGSGNGNDGIVGGVKTAAWNTNLANGGVERSGSRGGSGSGNSVMGGGLWPALSESIGIGGKVSPPGSSELSLDGSNVVLEAPIVSQPPPPPKQVKPNANQHSNTNHGKRPAKKSGSVSGGGTSSTYNRPPPPPPLPPPPPPFPLVGMYGNLVPAVLESPQPPFKGNTWSARPVDPSLNRNPARRNNYAPRPINNGYGGRRDHHGSRSPTPRDVHMQHQMGPPPPPPVRPFMRPPFMPPPIRPYGAPMGYEMGPSYVYVPTLPEPYRSGAPVLSHGPPGTMFMPRIDTPTSDDPILKQIEYYFSDDNLVKDNFLRSHMDEEGWVSLTLIAGFRRVEHLTKDIQVIVNSIKNSSIVEFQDDKMRRRNDWRRWIHTGSQSHTSVEEALFKNLTEEDKLSNDREVGPSSSLKLPNGEVTCEEPSL